MAVDVDGFVWWLNDAAYAAVGSERRVGEPTGTYNLLRDEQYARSGFPEACRQMLAEGGAFEEDVAFNLTKVSSDKGLCEDQLLRFIGAPLREDAGEIAGGLIQFVNVTREQTARRALESSEARLRSYLDHTQRCVWCYEPRTPIPLSLQTNHQFEQLLEAELVECNQAYARAHGAEFPRDLLGQKIKDLNSAQVGLLEKLYGEMMLNGGRLEATELEQRAPDGSRRIVEASVLAVSEQGSLVRVWGTFDDVTAEKLVEEERALLKDQLHHAQRLESVGALAGGVAHDFNNALMVIIANVQMALEEEDVNALKPLLRDIEQAAQHGASLTRDLLTFSRRHRENKTEIAVQPLLEGAERILRRLIPESVVLRVTAPPEHLWVVADLAQLQQLLVNLVVNARDAVKYQGTVTIDAQEVVVDDAAAEARKCAPGRYLRIGVQDTGEGISPEIRQRMFEPFFTTKPTGKGTGLGLSIVYGIVQSHGGFITVDSQEGRGSTVAVHVPLLEEVSEERVASVSEVPSPQGNGRTVLLAEDERLVREVTQRLLERSGYRVTTAADGSEAWALFQASPDGFDAVVMDAVMPALNGRELFARIRSLRPRQPVLVCSGYVERVAGARNNEFSRAPFLNKPYSRDELLTSLDALLASA